MQNILADIHQYSDTLTISQVVTFFARKGRTVTRSMVQNYVRDGLLPPPLNKRQYTAQHLATLALIDYLKGIYEMADIKRTLAPFMGEGGISPQHYAQWVGQTAALAEAWQQQLGPRLDACAAEERELLRMLHCADLRGHKKTTLP